MLLTFGTFVTTTENSSRIKPTRDPFLRLLRPILIQIRDRHLQQKLVVFFFYLHPKIFVDYAISVIFGNHRNIGGNTYLPRSEGRMNYGKRMVEGGGCGG